MYQAAAELDGILAEVAPLGGIRSALITAGAAGLPGLVGVLKDRIRRGEHTDDADYGDAMLMTMAGEPVSVLGPDALSLACHELAVRMAGNALPKGHLDELAFTGPSGELPADPGPARLHFRGQDHYLEGKSFLLGRDPSCDLVFESELYPHVSAKHCEIIFDRRHYTLHDRSRHGTLLNDRPVNQQAPLHSGDWIRLGPRGPVLRFIGQGRP